MHLTLFQQILQLVFFAIVLVGPVPLCLTILNYLENKNDSSAFSHRLLILTSCWTFIQTLTSLVLGISGQLNLVGVLVMEAGLVIMGILSLVFINRKNTTQGLKSIIGLPKEFDNSEKLILVVISFFALGLLWTITTQPIREYDSLTYHLPTMAQWTQDGTFSLLPQYNQIAHYPYNWEALSTLFIFPFAEDFLVALPNFLAWMLFGLAVYLLSLELGAKRIQGLAAAALVLMMPLSITNVNTMHIDIALAAFFLIALYFSLIFFKKSSPGYLILFFLSLGMLLGIKGSGLVYGALLVTVFLALAIKHVLLDKRKLNFSNKSQKYGLAFLIIGGASSILLGGFWYLRNLAQLGNPLGFVKIKIGSITLFPGHMNPARLYKTTLANTFDFSELLHWKIMARQFEVKLGIPFFLLFVLLIILVLFKLFSRKNTLKTHVLGGLLALLTLTFCLYWLTPYSACNTGMQKTITPWMGQAIRYAFPFLGVLGVLGALGLKITGIRKMALTALVLVAAFPGIIHIAGSIGITGYRMLYFVVILLLAWGIWQVSHFPPRLIKISLTVVLILIAALAMANRQVRDSNRQKSYSSIPGFIEKNIAQNEVIGILNRRNCYLFYGKNLDRKVKALMGGKIRAKELSQWLKVLGYKSIRWIAVYPNQRRKTRNELLWLKDSPEYFELLYNTDVPTGPKIYRLKERKF